MTAIEAIPSPAVPMTADVPKRTLTDQIIELVALSPGITAKEIAVTLCRDTAAVKGALNQLSFGRLDVEKDRNGTRPVNRYYLGPLAKQVWANGAWRVPDGL